MHVLYVPENTDYWLSFYKHSISTNPHYQLGGNLPGFRAYSPSHRGAGLGSFFKSLFRVAMPLLKSAGKQALIAGSKIVNDVSQGVPLKESARVHSKTAAGELLRATADRMQYGTGLGKRKRSKKRSISKNNKQLISKSNKRYKKKRSKKSRSLSKRVTHKAVGFDVFAN